MERIKYVARACRWFDKVNGNTYHSVRITRCIDGEVIRCAWQYGYDDAYRQTALEAMMKAEWLPKGYAREHDNGSNDLGLFERENGYPIQWEVSDGLKREMVANGA